MPAYIETLSSLPLPLRQRELWLNPHIGVEDHLEMIYGQNPVIEIGWPNGIRIPEPNALPNTAAAVGKDYGDEGKGRGVDNDTEMLLAEPGVESIDITRTAGGHNAGHTIFVNGQRLALHIIPSGVAYENSRNIIGRETTVHPEDLKTEYDDIEDKLGKNHLKGRVIVSYEAKFNHDIDRAEEDLYTMRTKPKKAGEKSKAGGGTGRGMPASEAHRYDRTVLSIGELVTDPDWRGKMETYYDDMTRLFRSFGINLAKAMVPDFAETIKLTEQVEEPPKRPVGNKKTFIDRIAEAREWLIANNMVQNTVAIHREAYNNPKIAKLFEGAQAMGLHPSLGKRPDVTSTDPSLFGVITGTGVYLPEDIEYRRAYSKGRYNSVVGADWPKQLELDPETADRIRNFAYEYGATTGRPRTILAPSIPMEQYNYRFSKAKGGVETHTDVAWKGEKIKMVAYFTDTDGNVQHYQPGMVFQRGLIPHWVELPGWDGEQVSKAKKIEDLPLELLQFLAFKQARTGYPIEAITTGPHRENFIEFPGYRLSK